jgi:hypothetical protein
MKGQLIEVAPRAETAWQLLTILPELGRRSKTESPKRVDELSVAAELALVFLRFMVAFFFSSGWMDWLLTAGGKTKAYSLTDLIIKPSCLVSPQDTHKKCENGQCANSAC